MANKAEEKCRNAIFILGFLNPHFLMVHRKLRYRESKKQVCDTMGITKYGTILINPEFVEKLDIKEVGGVLAHEILHLVLLHHTRLGGRDPWTWNIAADMCINKALQTDGIKLPSEAILPPNNYNGDLFVEAVYEWLIKNKGDKGAPNKPKKGEQPMPGRGCAVIDDPDDKPNIQQDSEGKEGDAPDWKQIAIEMRAMAQQAGQGASGIAHLLAPREPRIDWRRIVRYAFELASGRPGRDWQTFAKKHRRSPVDGPQFPGWIGVNPKLAVAIDVSGSMDRKWIDQIVAECKNLIKQFPNTRLYLVAHTSEVVWEGWIVQNTQHKLVDAVQFSGGTDPTPAYEAIAKAGKFSVLCHFTDTEFGCKWPDPPARHLIVGSFAREISTPPPAGSRVIICSAD